MNRKPHTEETKQKISCTKTIHAVIRRKCVNCGETYETKPYLRKKFCGKGCKNIMGGRKGSPLSIAMRRDLSKRYKGKGNPIWRGGLSKFRGEEKHSWRYREWRKSVYIRDNYTCQVCEIRGGAIEADHIRPWAEYREGWYDINNGRTLCKPCHKDITIKYLKFNWKNQYVSSTRK